MSKAIEQPKLPSFFYFLITGTLYVRIPNPDMPEETQDIAVPTLNVVIKTEMPYFGKQAIADANTGLQIRYRTDSKDEIGIIENVVLNSVFPMGFMTEEEYAKRKPAPEGV